MLRATSFLHAGSTFRLLLAVTILNLALPPAAEACSCAEQLSVADSFDLAEAVFYGEVLSRRVEGNYLSPYQPRAVLTFRVLQSWKGVTGELVGLVTPPGGASCGTDFEVGELRLVYANDGNSALGFEPGVLVSHLCLRCTGLFFPCIPTEEIEEIENLGHEPLTLTPGEDPLFPPLPLPNWAMRSLGGPTPRYLTEIAYDSARGVAVLYGGLILPSSMIGDTWEWNGTDWLQRSTSGPSPRAYHALVFDDARNVSVLFGGSGGGFKNDTWEWDGASWDLRSEAGPSARYLHAMAYDSDRAVTVLFGGWDGAMLDDTWEWDGMMWVQRGTGGPSARNGHAMAYDSQRHVVVLFGGVGADVPPEGDTWEWNGSAWSLRATTGPPPRMWHEMCFDPRRGVTVLYGGSEDGNGISVFGDTWEWDGTNWTQTATSGPTAKYSFGLAFDSGRDRAVLFGGATFGETYRETWEYGDGLTSIPPIPAVGGFGLLVIAASMIAAGAWIMRKRRTLAE